VQIREIRGPNISSRRLGVGGAQEVDATKRRTLVPHAPRLVGIPLHRGNWMSRQLHNRLRCRLGFRLGHSSRLATGLNLRPFPRPDTLLVRFLSIKHRALRSLDEPSVGPECSSARRLMVDRSFAPGQP